jgi:PAS domain S-box-containing protein
MSRLGILVHFIERKSNELGFFDVKYEEYNTALDYYKDRVFRMLALIILFLTVPLLILGGIQFMIEGNTLYGVIEILFSLMFALVLFLPGLKLSSKKALSVLVMYTIGVFLLITTGKSGAGMIVILFTLVLSSCILSKRSLVQLIRMNIVFFVLLSIALYSNLLNDFEINNYKSVWIINVLTMQSTGIGLLILISRVYEGLEKQHMLVKKSREALLLNEQKHEEMINNISDVIAIMDENGSLKYHSLNVKKLFNYEPNDLLGLNYRALIHPDDVIFFEGVINRIMTNPGEPITFLSRFRVESHRSFAHLEVTAVNMLDNPYIDGILFNYHDVSERIKNEKALLEAKNDAEEANKAKSRFLSVMSHEIRTPLNGVMGMLQLLNETHVDDTQREFIETSMQASETLFSVINDILDFTKIEANMFVIEKTVVNVPKLVHNIKLLYKGMSDSKQLGLGIQIDDTVPTYIKGDEVRLKQVLSNIVNNAIKFTERGRVDIKLSMASENEIRWRVVDTGIGIPKDKQASIFDSFKQGEDSTSRKFGGTGLGLAICKGIINAMGGDISVESHAQMGTTFTFVTPFEQVESKNEKPYVELIEQTETCHILVVEDDEVSRLVLKRFIEMKGWTCKLVPNGLEGLLEAENNYDLIIMDVHMPVCDGLEATRQIRKNGIKTPIVAMTAYAFNESRQECLDAGMNDYLSKPVNINDLTDMVRKWI